MRIAQISTLATPVRRDNADSIEHIVWLLTEALVQMGHEVTLFACAGSETSARLVATLPGPYGAPGSIGNWQTAEQLNLAAAIARCGAGGAGDFDILHSHAYLWGLPLKRFSSAPMLHTLHVQPYDDEAMLWSMHPNAAVTALSKSQWSAFPDRRPVAIIPHGLDPAQFAFQARPPNYLCFLGRLIPEKGVLEAIAVARKLNMPLRIAGRSTEYFERHIRPHVDGQMIEYVGPVTGAAKSQFLGGCAALLYPIRKPEPFGLVPVEAMLCGTPVAAINLGAVPEIIDEGITGFCADAIEGLPAAVERCLKLDRRAIRRVAETRFSCQRMADDYLKVYQRMLNHR